MESVGAFYDEEFDFLKMFTNVDDDFLLSNPPDHFSQNFPQAFLHESTDSNIMAHNNFCVQSFDSHNIIQSYVSHQESSNSSGSEIQGYFQNGSHQANKDNNVDSFLTLPNNTPNEFMHFLAMDTQNVGVNTNNAHQGVTTLASGSLDQLKRKLDSANPNSCNELEAPKKKPRVPRNTQKNKKSNKGQTKKNKKIVEDNNEANEDKNEGSEKQIQAPTSSMSEDDFINAFEEANGEVTTSECRDSSVPNSKGKTRAARGNATDPQSLYARKRRERINERLRVLQNLVPNGTKVDISTMLEEAVQYVKFLQLQIQLLSSDDMWMFAPLAFNGIDVGVYQRMFPHL